MVRRRPGAEEECGVLYDALHALGRPGYSATVFLTNLKSTTPDVYDLLESKHSGGFLTVAPKDYAPAQAIEAL